MQHGQGRVVRVDGQLPLHEGDGLFGLSGVDQHFGEAGAVEDVARVRDQDPVQHGDGLRVFLRPRQRQREAVLNGQVVGLLPKLALEHLHHRLRGIREVQARPVAHHLVVERARIALDAVLQNLAAGVRDPRFTQRVGQQELRGFAGVAVGAVHALEHPHHALGVKACPHHRVQAHPVRLLLATAAVAKLIGLGRRLNAGNRGHAGVAAANGADHDGGHHRRQGGQRLRPLHLDAAGEMALA